MNIATGSSVTAHDVVKIEKLQSEIEKLEGAVNDLGSALHSLRTDELEKAKRCVSSGAKTFARLDDSEDEGVTSLEREIALLRARLQAEMWRQWWKAIEKARAEVDAAFEEFRMARELSPILDCCVE